MNINAQASKCLEKCPIQFKTKQYDSVYKNEENYQKSFTDIIKFSKSIKVSRKKKINCIIFNKQNADGIFSAYITIKYLKKRHNGNIDVFLLPLGPHSGKGVDFNLKKDKIASNLKGKNIIIVDLSYNKESVNYLKGISNDLIIIDDHSLSKNALRNSKLNKDSYYIGNEKHSACAYTWKFFFRKMKVPEYVQIFDSNDRSLYLSWLGNNRPYFNFINYRFIHNPHLKWNNINSFNKIEDFINNANVNFAKFVGYYYDEVMNNIKEQIARNARLAYFQGHPVMVLNYRDPALGKMVQRQMLTNAEKQGIKVDFAVLWAYEYTNNLYNISLSEVEHGKPRFNLPEMAKKLGKLGGTGKGAGGSNYRGNIYWPRNDKMDIWDLFGKNPKYLV